jgi:Pregnancy-associated plasma protein-A/Secretion system C-terminal sorting domain
MKKSILLLVFCGIVSLTLSAQNEVIAPAYRMYSTQKWHSQVRQIEGVTDNMADIERYSYWFRTNGVIDSIQVPVVIHLMPLPAGTPPITFDDIQAQLDRLNEDFMSPRHPYLSEQYQRPALVYNEQGTIVGSQSDLQSYLMAADKAEHFAERAANPTIQFCLAAFDPNGQPTNGLVQPITTAKIWMLDNSIMYDSDGSNPWPAQNYLNIWVARLDDAAGAGWAQMPGGPKETDGIVIDDRFFVRSTTAQQHNVTLTHLVGSYLNLYELWSDAAPCQDDYVDDTPIHNAPNYGLAEVTYRHISTCDGNPVEMISNLMDNANDSLQYLFTWGQIMRMHATLSPDGPRGELRKTELTCTPTEGIVEGQDRANAAANTPKKGQWTATLSPNPTTDQFTVTIKDLTPDAPTDIRIYDNGGHELNHQTASADASGEVTARFSAQAWGAGLYLVIVRSGEQQETLRVVIE